MAIIESKYIWMNGKYIAWKDATVHVLTHALHYGGSVYEGMRAYEISATLGRDGKSSKKMVSGIFRLDEHIERFINSMKAIAMKPKYTKAQFKKICIEILMKNKIKDGYLRPIAFYGYERLGIYWGGLPVDYAIAAFPWGPYLPGEMKLKISPFERISYRAVKIGAKVGAYYVNSNYATEHAKNVTPFADEALFLDVDGNVAEAACANILFVKKAASAKGAATLVTPKGGKILTGLTRSSVMEIARDLGMKVVERDIKPSEIYGFDEAFTTGTATQVTSVVKINNKKIGSGKAGEVTKLLAKTFDDAIHGKIKKYRKWLTIV
jgi:branched-chain amino acid aminotransferase